MGRIQLANSAQAASRANREARIAARHASQPVRDPAEVQRHTLSPCAAGAPSLRRDTATAAGRTTAHPARASPSIPARRAYSCRPASLSMNDRTSRSAACCASVGTFKCRPCFDARVHCGRTGQSRQSEALNRIETYGLRSASVYSFHPMLNRPRGQRAPSAPSRSRSPRRPAERPFHYPTTRQPYPLSLRLGQ